MFSHIIQRRLHNRLPEDSGEWLPVPVHFRHLPPPADPRQGRKLIGTSAATAIVQVALLSYACWAFFEYFKERDFLGLKAVATAVGLASSMAVGAWIARRLAGHGRHHRRAGVVVRADLDSMLRLGRVVRARVAVRLRYILRRGHWCEARPPGGMT